MGYASTSIILYGVKLSEEQAEQIYEDYFDNEGLADLPSTPYFRIITDYEIQKGRVQQYPISPYAQHSKGSLGSSVFDTQLLSNGSDSRMDNQSYDEGMDHYFGIYVASTGYGYEDTFNYFLNNIPQEAIDNYNNHVMDILKKYNIEENPSIEVVNQMW